MNRDYYQKYYQIERTHWWFRVRELIISDRVGSLFPADRNLNILNVGSATGRSSENLLKFGRVTSVEFDEECCDFCKKELGLEVIQGSILNLPFPDEHFDLVCAFDVIEHIENDQSAMDELIRVCKKGGHLVVTVPALMALWGTHDEVNHHYRRYTRKQLLKLIPKNGANRVYCSYFNSLLFPFIFVHRTLSRLGRKKPENSVLKSDFEVRTPAIITRMLQFVFELERPLLRKMSFPVGVSILLSWSK